MPIIPLLVLGVLMYALASSDTTMSHGITRAKARLKQLAADGQLLLSHIAEMYEKELQPFVRRAALAAIVSLLVLSLAPFLRLMMLDVVGDADQNWAWGTLGVGMAFGLIASANVFASDKGFSIFKIGPRLALGYLFTGLTIALAGQWCGARVLAMLGAAVVLGGVGIAYVFARFLGKIGVLSIGAGENGLNAFKLIMAGFVTSGKLTDKLTEQDWDIAKQEDIVPLINAAFIGLVSFLLPLIDVSIIAQNPDVMGAVFTAYVLISIGWTVFVLAGEKDHVKQLRKRSAYNLNRLNMGAAAIIFLAAAVSGFSQAFDGVFTALSQLLLDATSYVANVLKGRAGLPLLPIAPAVAGLVLGGLGVWLFRPKGTDAAFKRERTWFTGALGLIAAYCFVCLLGTAMSWNHEKDVLTIKGAKTNAEMADLAAKDEASAPNPGGRRALVFVTGKLSTAKTAHASTTAASAPQPAQTQDEEEEEDEEDEAPQAAQSPTKSAFCQANPRHAWCR